MAIVRLMTSDTVRLGILKLLIGMTFITRRDGMQPNQWKGRQIMVKVYLLRPCCFTMAILADESHLSLVNIISFMTINAVPWFCPYFCLTPMTGETVHILMRAGQNIFCVLVMGEAGFTPIRLAVTLLTFHPVPALVNIHIHMTVIAFGQHLFLGRG